MEPVDKLRDVVDGILNVDAAQRKAAGGVADIDPQTELVAHDTPEAECGDRPLQEVHRA